ncbi:MerR family transcriptional regulator [Actinoplanes sp. TBRC 11911]|uniref:DNA polymerase III subunit beta family protein n=1 Tax=Actinoplanes sp. TBRC 11911 TaxID=2729386 RepID=UPI00145F0FB5|nr:MerR family transcriptional regulator [Actinoplanes sp. TBRC 11911]NMO50482.1 MerR family transcriptional regulator [Actinoplanes sp. TBRC 11911]
MRSIGEVARVSGLTVSALRFYDGAGVLVPAEVDAATGYRRYADEQVRAARLVAGLRRVGMPVAEIAKAVAEEPAAVRERLERHRRRLEHGLADAQRELLRIHALLDLEEHLMTRITLPAAALAATIDAVRFAVGRDPEMPALGGILFDTTAAGALTLVATDRFRMAVAGTAATVEGPGGRHLLPADFVDELRPLLTGTVTIDVTTETGETAAARIGTTATEAAATGTGTTGADGAAPTTRQTVVADTGGRTVATRPFDVDFPDHKRLMEGLGAGARRVTVDTAVLRSQVAAAPALTREHDGTAYEVAILEPGAAGGVRLVGEGEWADEHVAVNREFLLQALDAGAAGQLVLELDGPIRPLAVRVPGDSDRFSILMPVRR